MDTACEKSSFWVFGYSSLCWNPGFTYNKCCIGYVKGYSRKFWQGSVSHRGTEEQPGRVATLIENDSDIVWGCIFEVTPDSSAFRYLETRECSNGGYLPKTITFYPEVGEYEQPIQALTFIAYAGNPFWLGNAPLTDISSQVIESKGMAGHNVEYVLRLTDYMREHIPQERDPELFQLENLVIEQIGVRNLRLSALLNDWQTGLELEEDTEKETNTHNQQSTAAPSTSRSTFTSVAVGSYFTCRVPDKKLRCVNI